MPTGYKIKKDQKVAFAYAYIANNFSAPKAFREAVNNDVVNPSVQGCKLLKDPLVSELVTSLTLKHLAKLDIQQQHIIKELALLGFSDIGDFINCDGNSMSIKNIDDIGEQRRAIKKLKIIPCGDGERIEIELHDKIRPLENLGKNVGMFRDTILQPLDEAQKIESDKGYNARIKELRQKAIGDSATDAEFEATE